MENGGALLTPIQISLPMIITASLVFIIKRRPVAAVKQRIIQQPLCVAGGVADEEATFGFRDEGQLRKTSCSSCAK